MNPSELKVKVNNYLKIQGLDINPGAVHECAFILNAILTDGHFDLTDSPVWNTLSTEANQFKLTDFFEQNNETNLILKTIYGLLHIVLNESDNAANISNISYFVAAQSNTHETYLLPLCQLTTDYEEIKLINNDKIPEHLAIRTYYSGWFTHVDDSSEWIASNELIGDRHSKTTEQWSAPVFNDDDQVIGLIYGESLTHLPDTSFLKWWVALAIVLNPLTAALNKKFINNFN